MTKRSASADKEVGHLVRQRDRFLAFVQRRTRDAATAEDILQSAYVKALASQASLRDRTSVVRWFFQILKRSVVDHHRRSASAQRANDAVRARARSADLDTGLKAAVCACVDSLIPGLPPDQGALLRRVDLGAQTPAEATARHGMTPGNAAVRIHRARKALRAKLEASCGACTRHRCLDCHCEPSRR